jgi:hypothetical protein
MGWWGFYTKYRVRQLLPLWNNELMNRFHYKPSVAWPPAPGDGITVTMPDGSDAHFDEQVQMYW